MTTRVSQHRRELSSTRMFLALPCFTALINNSLAAR
ncbi:Uncharacterised protein [Mycobacteroides abscessus subsp. abscessus]|nr:Uncharacterised protein [Mycobacteroides abscessus subsp. abscessus]